MSKKKLKPSDKYPWVRVEWIDSSEPFENAEVAIPSEIPEPQRIIQVGFLVQDTADAVTIAGGWKPDLLVADYVISIPKTSILGRVERLERLTTLKKAVKPERPCSGPRPGVSNTKDSLQDL